LVAGLALVPLAVAAGRRLAAGRGESAPALSGGAEAAPALPAASEATGATVGTPPEAPGAPVGTLPEAAEGTDEQEVDTGAAR
jgi:hypothetical protein